MREEIIKPGTKQSGKLLTGADRAQRQPMRLLVLLCIVAVFAASCASDATSTTADEAPADEPNVTTTAEPEVTTTAEPEVEENPAPDAAIVAFTEAFGVADSEAAWGFLSDRCKGGSDVEVHPGFAAAVDGWAADHPNATAVDVVAVFANSDTAAISYNVNESSGEFAEAYNSQPWIFENDNWVRDDC